MRVPTVLVVVCLAFVTATAFGQTHPGPSKTSAAESVPPLVRFSGGTSHPGASVTITFALYRDQVGGEPLWTETQTLSTDTNGRYGVVLGAAAGLPPEVFWAGEARWMGVQVAGEAEQPRVLLVSVPYALKAADADTVAGKPLSAFVLAGDTTGVGADGLTYVDTRVLKQGLKTGGPQAAGSPGYLGVFTSSTEMANSVVYQAGTSIGVNATVPAATFHAVATSAPGALFDVYSNALGALPVVYRAARGTPALPSAVQTDDILGGLAVRGYAASGFTAGRGQVMFRAAENWTDAANGTYLEFTTTPIGSATWAERMRITPDGNVGIGMATPSQRLSVAGVIESTTGGFRFPDGTIQASAVSFAGSNIGVGMSSLAANTTGAANSAFGSWSLSSNTEGQWNSALGWGSLSSNSTGFYNTAVGASSLIRSTEGWENSALGFSSLYSNETGSYNSAFGASSLYSNVSGEGNSALGDGSLYSNTTGWYNTAVGLWALWASTEAWENSAFGYSSLSWNETGSYNSAFGNSSLNYNVSGSENSALGYLAGYTSAGNGNTFLGARTDVADASVSYATAVGAGATVAQSNALVLGGTAGTEWAVNVGIGTSAPDTTLHVVGDIKAGTTGTNGCLKNFAGGTIAGTCSSDLRLKRNIRPLPAVLDRVARLRPVYFEWRAAEFPEYHFGAGLNSGLVAQDVEQVFPEMVATDDRGFKMVNYTELPLVTLSAVKELKSENDALKAEIATLRAQVQQLAAAIVRR